MFLVIGLCILILLLYRHHISIKRRLNILSQIPGPKGIPIFGNTFTFVTKNLEEIFDMISEMAIKYGGSYKIYGFNRIIIVATDPYDIQDILSSSKHIEKNYLYELLHTWLGDGLLLSGGLKWHSRRKIITPTFHFKILEEFLHIFNQQSDILIEKLQEYCENDHLVKESDLKIFDIHNLIALAALDVIAETAMGIKINAQIDSSCEYVNAILEIAEVIAHRFIRIWLRNDFLCSIFANFLWKRQQKALNILHNFTEKIIMERRDLLLKKENQLKIEENVDDNFGQKKRLAFLDVLLQSNINGKPLSNMDIREEVDTFMFEGHDTTTSAICFTLVLLSRHSRVQQKVFHEIVQTIGSDIKKPATYQNLQDLKYLDLVIKESLRMYPPVAVIGRKIEEDTVINSKPIPANTQFIIYLQGLMRNPIFFKDPNSFIPERHTNIPETYDTNEFNPYAYIPFSAGPRNCIGQKFAILELKSIISKILRHFELLPGGPDVKPLMDIILRSKTGFHLGIRTRKY